MLDLTFGEQVKIILSRKGMTIKELAETIQEKTGKKMSRQNLTQRLGRDNFQEQDMRMIAEILECPFRLNILETTDAEELSDAEEPSEAKELSDAVKLSEAKELSDAIEQVPSEIEHEANEKEMTLGEYLDIHEELKRQETGKNPRLPEAVMSEIAEMEMPEAEAAKPEEAVKAEKDEKAKEHSITDYIHEVEREEEEENLYTDVEEVLREIEELERDNQKVYPRILKKPEENRREEKKAGGWRAVFQRLSKREAREAKAEEERIEKEILEDSFIDQEPDEDDYIDYEHRQDEYMAEPGELFMEPAEQPEEKQPEDVIGSVEEIAQEVIEENDEEAEDLSKGELNPYTGHEYESNSVRMHPKRIGYVQVYDRRDHSWTDMTEWAFLGYQERKRALLGKDYEEPIYLD